LYLGHLAAEWARIERFDDFGAKVGRLGGLEAQLRKAMTGDVLECGLQAAARRRRRRRWAVVGGGVPALSSHNEHAMAGKLAGAGRFEAARAHLLLAAHSGAAAALRGNPPLIKGQLCPAWAGPPLRGPEFL